MLQSEETNNPLNDSIKARDLFNDEVAAFSQTDETLKQIFYMLLHRQKEFQSFFVLLQGLTSNTSPAWLHTKKTPYSISTFHDLIAQHYYYVDKTKYIEVLEQFNEKYICFFRPLRYGKSLFVLLLCNYYDKAKAKAFDAIFSELYIGKNPTPLKNAYHIMDFDF